MYEQTCDEYANENEQKFFWSVSKVARGPRWRLQTHKNGHIIIVLEFKENLLWHHDSFYFIFILRICGHFFCCLSFYRSLTLDSSEFGIFLCTMYSTPFGVIHVMRDLSLSISLTLIQLHFENFNKIRATPGRRCRRLFFGFFGCQWLFVWYKKPTNICWIQSQAQSDLN